MITVQLFNIKQLRTCEVSRLPDHDILIDYGLIVNIFFFGGGESLDFEL